MLKSIPVISILEIIILWAVIYRIMLFFERTRAIQVIRGIIILLLALLLFKKLNLEVLDWLLTKLFGISVITMLIIFHPEIRQGLARLGQQYLFGAKSKEEELDSILNQVIKATENLCKNKVGALIVIEKNDPLNAYVESGLLIDARISSDLIQTIFTPNSLLHDGALLIRYDRIIAAGCILPLVQNQDLSRIYGTRHRAALGLSEESDALIIVVSEERQDMSLAYRGKLHKDLSRQDMLLKIKEAIKLKRENV